MHDLDSTLPLSGNGRVLSPDGARLAPLVTQLDIALWTLLAEVPEIGSARFQRRLERILEVSGQGCSEAERADLRRHATALLARAGLLTVDGDRVDGVPASRLQQ